MKLSKLITYKHMVDGLSVNHMHDKIEQLLQDVENNLSIQQIDFENIKHKMSANKKIILNTLHNIDIDLQNFKQELTKFVTDIEPSYHAKSQQIYEEDCKNTVGNILDRFLYKKLLYKQETFDFLCNRIKAQASWQWPAMQIRPAHCDLTDALTACDPLYLVDLNKELLTVAETKWTPEYQRRLRYYTVNENDKTIFHQLPQAQLGLIVAVDFFNFRPLKLIEHYLNEFFGLLRPGGVVIFTYNNCDFSTSVVNFENCYNCYTPGRQIKEISTKIGFHIASSFDLSDDVAAHKDYMVSWLELKAPGTISSFRGGQTLGKIENI